MFSGLVELCSAFAKLITLRLDKKIMRVLRRDPNSQNNGNIFVGVPELQKIQQFLALKILNALESGHTILSCPIVSANKYSFLGNVHMCQDRATVANPSNIPEYQI